MGELVSCIAATRNRRRFFRQALTYFLRQTYQPSELIVVDDGEDPVGDLCAGLDRVCYLRIGRPAATGAKLNIGIEQARGPILHKWDDDDYYHPDFLRLAVERLVRADPQSSLVAWDCFLILIAGEEQLRYSGESFPAGGSFCFHRRLWERAAFRDVPRSVDSWFLEDHHPTIIRVDAPEHHLVLRHGANTWTRMRDGRVVDEFLAEFPIYPKPLDAVLDPADCAFYRSVCQLEWGRPPGLRRAPWPGPG